MAINYKNIKSNRQWIASIGMKEENFLELIPHFKFAYKDIFGVEMQARQNKSSKEACFRTYAELLFFLLFSLKSRLTYDALGFVFGMTGSTAKKNHTLGLKLLKVTLKNISLSSVAAIKNIEVFKKLMPGEKPMKKMSRQGS